MITQVATSFPVFAQFMNSQGLPTLFDNLDFKGAEQLKVSAEKWQQQMQQAQSQNANTPPPEMQKLQFEGQKLQAEQARNQQDYEIRKEENAIKLLNVQNDRTKILAELNLASKEELIEKERMHTETINKAADIALERTDLNRTHDRADMELSHRLMNNIKEEA